MARLNNIPAIFEEAKQNLVSPSAPYAKAAIDLLADTRSEPDRVVHYVTAGNDDSGCRVAGVSGKVIASLEAYRAWLQNALPALPPQSAIGRENYTWLLRNVALMPYTPEDLVAQAEPE